MFDSWKMKLNRETMLKLFKNQMKGMDFSEYFFENFGGFRSQNSFVALPLSKDSKN